MNEDLEPRVPLWVSAKFWNLDQISWLLLGYDPILAKESAVLELSPEEKKVVRDAMHIFDLQFDGSSGSRRFRPVEAIDHFANAGLNFPTKLRDAVSAAERSSSQTKQETKATPEPKKIVALKRERDTLQKLCLAMAVQGYRYDPKASKSKAISDIETDARTLGLSIDRGTILKHLRNATEEHNPDINLNSE